MFTGCRNKVQAFQRGKQVNQSLDTDIDFMHSDYPRDLLPSISNNFC